MVNIVNKGLRLRIFPDNDMIKVLEQNMGNACFVWNNILVTNRRIRLAKLDYVHYHASSKYKKLLKSNKNQQCNCKKRKWQILRNSKHKNHCWRTEINWWEYWYWFGIKESSNTLRWSRDNQSRPKKRGCNDSKIPEKIIQTKIHEQKLSKNIKKILQMARPEKE